MLHLFVNKWNLFLKDPLLRCLTFYVHCWNSSSILDSLPSLSDDSLKTSQINSPLRVRDHRPHQFWPKLCEVDVVVMELMSLFEFHSRGELDNGVIQFSIPGNRDRLGFISCHKVSKNPLSPRRLPAVVWTLHLSFFSYCCIYPLCVDLFMFIVVTLLKENFLFTTFHVM